jgi:hypothetical protein
VLVLKQLGVHTTKEGPCLCWYWNDWVCMPQKECPCVCWYWNNWVCMPQKEGPCVCWYWNNLSLHATKRRSLCVLVLKQQGVHATTKRQYLCAHWKLVPPPSHQDFELTQSLNSLQSLCQGEYCPRLLEAGTSPPLFIRVYTRGEGAHAHSDIKTTLSSCKAWWWLVTKGGTQNLPK